MKSSFAVVVLLGCMRFGNCGHSPCYLAADGDIVFQVSQSSQSVAVQQATGSPYSHMGIVFLREGEPYVLEAVEPVKITALADWAERGEGGEFVAKRLKNALQVLTPEALSRMEAVGRGFLGKHYDLYFEWSDDRIYCSELVWKIYERGLGIDIGQVSKLREFDLSSPAVKEKLNERWGGDPPLEETVISPAAMFESVKLVQVFKGTS